MGKIVRSSVWLIQLKALESTRYLEGGLLEVCVVGWLNLRAIEFWHSSCSLTQS